MVSAEQHETLVKSRVSGVRASYSVAKSSKANLELVRCTRVEVGISLAATRGCMKSYGVSGCSWVDFSRAHFSALLPTI